jgi:fucose permease
VTVVGLFVVGVGLSLLYPLTFALAVESARGRTEAASARSVFAAGAAVAAGPFALGALADQAGLDVAFVIVPVLLAVGAVILLFARRG